jgi:predicted RNA-binding Zn ribbon-like protein
MKPSETFAIPDELATLYDFANSLDLRRYRDRDGRHSPSDALGTRSQATDWLRAHGLWSSKQPLNEQHYQHALALRAALRDVVAIDPALRDEDIGALRRLEAAAARFPLTLGLRASPPMLELRPLQGVGKVVAQLFRLFELGDLDRLKMCASDDCHWIFFDRTKPANRRWCSSDLCGNRAKVKRYRAKGERPASALRPRPHR